MYRGYRVWVLLDPLEHFILIVEQRVALKILLCLVQSDQISGFLMSFHEVRPCRIHHHLVICLIHHKFVIHRGIIKCLLSILAVLKVDDFTFWDHFSYFVGLVEFLSERLPERCARVPHLVNLLLLVFQEFVFLYLGSLLVDVERLRKFYALFIIWQVDNGIRFELILVQGDSVFDSDCLLRVLRAGRILFLV